MEITTKEIKMLERVFEEIGEKRFSEFDDEEKTLLKRFSEEEEDFLKKIRKSKN